MKALEDPALTVDQRRLLHEIQGVRYVVISDQHGGFGLSQAGVERYLRIKGIDFWTEHSNNHNNLVGPRYWLVPQQHRVNELDSETWHEITVAERQQHNHVYSQQVFCDRDLVRDDPVLVQVVRELGNAANSRFSNLKIVEIPADVEWQIEEYDGQEWVAEKHRTWA